MTSEEIKKSCIWQWIRTSANILIRVFITICFYLYFNNTYHQILSSLFASTMLSELCMFSYGMICRALNGGEVEVTEYYTTIFGNKNEVLSYGLGGIVSFLFHFLEELVVLAVATLAFTYIFKLMKTPEAIVYFRAFMVFAFNIPVFMGIWHIIKYIRIFLAANYLDQYYQPSPTALVIIDKQNKMQNRCNQCLEGPPIIYRNSGILLFLIILLWPIRVLLGGLCYFLVYLFVSASKAIYYIVGALTLIIGIIFIVTCVIPAFNKNGMSLHILTEYWGEWLAILAGSILTFLLYKFSDLLDYKGEDIKDKINMFRYGI